MINQELAKIFYEIARMLDAENDHFRSIAYRRAAQSLAYLSEDAAEIYRRHGMAAVEEIPGVGKGIGEKIEEYILRGEITYYEELKRRFPIELKEIAAVAGLGPKRAKLLFEKLGVRNLRDLERAARGGKIAALFGFGDKSQANILQGIAFRKKDGGRLLLGEALPVALGIKSRLEKFDGLARVEIAGSLRRRKETIGDVDLLAAILSESSASAVIDFFTSLPEVEKIWAKGDTKSSVRTRGGLDIDLRLVPSKSFGAAWQYFTGSKDHNIVLRRIAKEKGFKLSEYGLFAGERLIAGKNEEEIYIKLGMSLIPPELRENDGEIEAARNNYLPNLAGYGDLRGDLHCHSDWNGGEDSIEALVAAARKMGYEYLGVADHTKFLKIENGLDEAALARRNFEIDALNEKNIGILVLKGCEANIMANGKVDIADESLAALDFAIAGVHSNLKMGKKEMTARIIRAMEHPLVDIISHPTGRLLKKRPECEIDFDAICAAAVKTGTILEVNAFPDRLDLSDRHIRAAKERGVKMIINSDSHRAPHLQFAEFGIAQARRGWAAANNIVNTLPWPKLRKILKRNLKKVYDEI